MRIQTFEMKHSKTRSPDLTIASPKPGLWGFFNEGSHVGPWYATKMEALADLHRYATEAGWTI